MRKIIFIGTLHAGLTPKNELRKILYSLNPNQLFVEVQQSEINSDNLSGYPEEMVFALKWARKNRILVRGFDVDIDVLKDPKNKNNNLLVLKKQKKIVKKHSWKDFNKDKYNELLNFAEANNLIDWQKWKLREKAMSSNIKRDMIKSGIIVIFTGTGHLSFFEKKFDKAEFPLR